jgi:hypothetical protein
MGHMNVKAILVAASCIGLGASAGALTSFGMSHAKGPTGATAQGPTTEQPSRDFGRTMVNAASPAEQPPAAPPLVAAAVSHARGSDAAASTTTNLETPEETERRVAADFHAVLANHSRDPIDPRWAPQTAEKYKTDISALQEKLKFDLMDIDCRTTSCAARLKFASANTASQNWGGILHSRYSSNCAVRVFLEGIYSVSNRADPFETTVLFDCTEARAGGS